MVFWLILNFFFIPYKHFVRGSICLLYYAMTRNHANNLAFVIPASTSTYTYALSRTHVWILYGVCFSTLWLIPLKPSFVTCLFFNPLSIIFKKTQKKPSDGFVYCRLMLYFCIRFARETKPFDWHFVLVRWPNGFSGYFFQ